MFNITSKPTRLETRVIAPPHAIQCSPPLLTLSHLTHTY